MNCLWQVISLVTFLLEIIFGREVWKFVELGCRSFEIDDNDYGIMEVIWISLLAHL